MVIKACLRRERLWTVTSVHVCRGRRYAIKFEYVLWKANMFVVRGRFLSWEAMGHERRVCLSWKAIYLIKDEYMSLKVNMNMLGCQ